MTDTLLKQADQSENRALVALASNEVFTLAVEGRGEEESLRFEVDGAPHIAALRPIQEGAGDWVIAVVAPEADFLAACRAAGAEPPPLELRLAFLPNGAGGIDLGVWTRNNSGGTLDDVYSWLYRR